MIRLITAAPPAYSVSRLREQAAARWSWLRFIDVRAVANGLALEFEDRDPPTQADVDSFVLAYDPTPPPPTAEQTRFDQAVALLKAGFGTPRTVTQLGDAVDAITVVLRNRSF